MRQLVTISALVVIGFGLVVAVAADEPKRDQAIYVDDYKDPVKMLTFTVHQDDVADILARVDGGR